MNDTLNSANALIYALNSSGLAKTPLQPTTKQLPKTPYQLHRNVLTTPKKPSNHLAIT